MILKNKLKLTQKLNQFTNVLARYDSTRDTYSPNRQQYLNLNMIAAHPAPHFYQINEGSAHDKIERREQSIKSIDDKIKNIMNKHSREASNDHIEAYFYSNNEQSILYNPSNHKSNKQEANPLSKQSQCPQANDSLGNSAKLIKKQDTGKLNNKLTKQEYKTNRYDSEIERFNERIKFAQEQKKKLNISFKPFTGNNQHPKRSLIRNNSHSLHSNSRPTYQQGANRFELPLQSSSKQKITKKGYSITSKAQHKAIAQAQPLPHRYKDSINLIERICRQISLDESFRNAKIWFECIGSQNKWQQLRGHLSSNQINKSMEQIKSIFCSSLDEHNPFYSAQSSSRCMTIEKLVEAYLNSDKNWRDTIANKFNLKVLQSIKFTAGNIDLEKKGFIALEDLVRYINMQSGNFYRNRDIILIYKRLGCNKSYKQFVEALVE